MFELIKKIEKIEQPIANFGMMIASLSIIIMMTIEVLNALGRKMLKPVPVTIETAENLMITTIFMAAGYVALKEEHTYVSLMTRKFGQKIRRLLDSFGQLVGALAFGFLSWGAWEAGWISMLQLEIRIGVVNFPIWIFRVFFALGLSLFTLQLLINTVKFSIQSFDPHWVDTDAVVDEACSLEDVPFK